MAPTLAAPSPDPSTPTGYWDGRGSDAVSVGWIRVVVHAGPHRQLTLLAVVCVVLVNSHNGRNLGKAFRRARGRGTGRYRVIAPNGVECRVGVDAASPVVEIYSPGTVLQVSQVENLSPSGTWRLRTAEGWVAERNVDDPDEFYTERLEQDTCDFAGHGAGAERCVFVDVLRLAAAEPGATAAATDADTDATTAATATTAVTAAAAAAAAAAASRRGGSNQGCASLQTLPDVAAPHGTCKDIVVGEGFAELSTRCGEELSSSGGGDSAAGDEVFDIAAATAQALSTPPPRTPAGACCLWQETDAGFGVPLCAGSDDGGSPKAGVVRRRPAEERRRPRRSLLTRSVEVGDADAVTFFVELFVPAGSVGDAAVGGGRWAWGVVIADFDVYLTTTCRSAETERDNGGGGGCGSDFCGAESAAAEQHASADEGRDDDDDDGGSGGGGARQANHDSGGRLLHIVIEGPGGFSHALPVCTAFRGRWMTLRIVAHRSGESLLVCTPGAEGQADDHERSSGDSGATSARPEVPEHSRELLAVEGGGGQQQQQQQQMVHQQRQLRCRFSNPRFFRGDRVGCVGLYSERFARPLANGSGGGGGGQDGFRFLARHAVILLGSLEEQPPPALARLRQLERLVSAEHSRRLTEPTARPLLVFARRLRQLWSGEVPLLSPPSSEALGTDTVGAAAAKKDSSSPTARRTSTPTLTVWQALLSPGRVAFGTTVCFSRNSIGTAPRSPRAGAGAGGGGGGGGDGGGGPMQRRSLTAWEHPALHTPARFEAVPLPGEMSVKAGGGQGLWAWAPVPRSEEFVAIGLVFTGDPEPPSLKSVRCVRSDFVVDAEPHKCKVMATKTSG